MLCAQARCSAQDGQVIRAKAQCCEPTLGLNRQDRVCQGGNSFDARKGLQKERYREVSKVFDQISPMPNPAFGHFGPLAIKLPKGQAFYVTEVRSELPLDARLGEILGRESTLKTDAQHFCATMGVKHFFRNAYILLSHVRRPSFPIEKGRLPVQKDCFLLDS